MTCPPIFSKSIQTLINQRIFKISMAKNEELMNNITIIYEALKKDLNTYIQQKYLSLLCLNYIEFIHDCLTKKFTQASENLFSQIHSKFKEIQSFIAKLKSANFFEAYGSYQKNASLIDSLVTSIHDLLSKVQPLLDDGPWTKINLDKQVLKNLDSAVEDCQQKIKEAQAKKVGKSDLNKNLKNIIDELTFILWFDHLALEGDIDDNEFLKNLERVLGVLGRDYKRMDRDKLINDVDRNRANAISPKQIADLFRFGLTYPLLKIYMLPETVVDDESDGEKTLKRRKKDSPKKKTAKKEDDDDNEDVTELRKVEKEEKKEDKDETMKRVKKKPKPDLSGIQISGDPQQKPQVDSSANKKDGFKFSNQSVLTSQIYFEYPLALTVIEVNEQEPGIFKVGSKILINRTTFQIDNQPKQQLKTKCIARFGRESNMEQYQSDIKFHKKLLEISRKQFQILSNDETKNQYTIVCTSPPPKTETSFKITDQPFLLREDNIILLDEEEVIQIQLSNESAVQKEEPADQEEEGTVARNQRNKKNAEMKIKEEKRGEVKQKVGNSPFLVIEGVCETSEIYGKKVIIDSSKLENSCYEFGKDYIFKKNKKANNGSKLYFEQGKGWFIVSHGLSDKKFKVFQTRVSVGLYDKIVKGECSDPVVLQTGMIIHICGFSFKVENGGN